MAPKLVCKDISKRFGSVQAADKVSVEFPSSGIVGLVGPNGAGKTTLLNILTGFVQADAGRCFVGEHEVTLLAPHRIARCGVARTFQDLRLILRMPVLDNVMLARPSPPGETLLGALVRVGVAAGEAKNRSEAMRLLKFVGLEDKATVLAGELSYGQQKLLTLVCCLAEDAEILLLDEPVAGLHPEAAAKILGLLCELREAGKLIVFIEHDLSAVRQVSDYVIVMDHGQVIAQGTPNGVLSRQGIVEAYLG